MAFSTIGMPARLAGGSRSPTGLFPASGTARSKAMPNELIIWPLPIWISAVSHASHTQSHASYHFLFIPDGGETVMPRTNRPLYSADARRLDVPVLLSRLAVSSFRRTELRDLCPFAQRSPKHLQSESVARPKLNFRLLFSARIRGTAEFGMGDVSWTSTLHLKL